MKKLFKKIIKGLESYYTAKAAEHIRRGGWA